MSLRVFLIDDESVLIMLTTIAVLKSLTSVSLKILFRAFARLAERCNLKKLIENHFNSRLRWFPVACNTLSVVHIF